MSRFGWFTLAAAAALVCCVSHREAAAITTAAPESQIWTYEPDAWTRGNSADSSYFGWDLLERNTPAWQLSAGRILDDSTPDLGSGITATGMRFYQGTDGFANPAPTAYGHVSSGNDYYSGFGATDFADNTIEGTAPASGAGGFTTVVLQLLSFPQNTNPDLAFAMNTPGWSLEKSLYGLEASGTDAFWLEWTALGADLPFEIHVTSTMSSRAFDAVQVDTFWSPTARVVNARSAIGVPEPAAGVLAALALGLATFGRRWKK